MNKQRANEIINNKKICNVYYNHQPVWIQEINNEIAKIGFMNITEEKSVNIKDLYE